MAHIRIDFLSRPQFHGLNAHARQEWPPSPLRLLGALIAGAHNLEGQEQVTALAALERLSATGPPTIHVSDSVPLHHPDTFTEKAAPGGASAAAGVLSGFLDLTHAHLETSSRTAKPTRGRLLASPTIVYDVGPIAEPDLRALGLAATGVGYFGRSQNHAVVTVTDDAPVPEELGIALYPELRPNGGQRGWTPASVSWFDARHEAMMNNPDAPLPAEAGAFTRLGYRPRGAAWRDDDSLLHHQNLTACMLTRGIRISDIPRVLRTVDVRQDDVTVLPLVNFNRSDARCYGFAATGPLQARLDAVTQLREQLGPLASQEAGAGSSVFDRYATMQPGTRWITATPIRAFGHPLMLERSLAESFPGKLTIEAAQTRPLDQWQQRLPDVDLADGLSQWFVRFTTAEPIPAPRMAGSQNRLGFGLCVPISHRGGLR